MATRTPPRFVPTLTEVVHAGQATPVAAEAAVGTAAAAATAPEVLLSPQAQEQLTQRVLQRLDLSLERRLREAIASVVLEQTSTLAPLLRERLETVVRDLVADAVAEECQSRQRGPGTSV